MKKTLKKIFEAKITKIGRFWAKFINFVFFAYNLLKIDYFDTNNMEIGQKLFFSYLIE